MIAYDHDLDLDIMGRTIAGEARGEPEEGRIAVGWVIANRATRHWAGDLLGKEGAVKKVCLETNQFSCWNEDDPNRAKIEALEGADLAPFVDLAQDVLDGILPDPTHGADHYFVDTIGPPDWAKAYVQTVHIGHHLFFNSALKQPALPPAGPMFVSHDQITKNFTLDELLSSTVARDLRIQNIPDGQSVLNLHSLASNVLQPLRDLLGHSVLVMSGFRTAVLNKAVGGASNSDHLIGCAADIYCPDFGPPKAIVEKVMASDIPFKQMIYEHPHGEASAWVHISWAQGVPKKQVLERSTPDDVYTPFVKE